MERRLENSVAVVTGSGSGIGREVAVTFAKHGAAVACFDKDESALQRTVSMIKVQGGKVLACSVDVSDSGQVNRAMEAVFAAFGKLDILVNCAAVVEDVPFEDTTDEIWHRVMDTNIGGYFYCLRAAYPYLKRAGSAKVVQFTSSSGLSGSGFGGASYAASKTAVLGLTKYLAGQWGAEGIRVNAICPSRTQAGGPPDDAVPLGRAANPGDIADTVLFLASEDARYITGATLHVNGGKHMYLT